MGFSGNAMDADGIRMGTATFLSGCAANLGLEFLESTLKTLNPGEPMSILWTKKAERLCCSYQGALPQTFLMKRSFYFTDTGSAVLHRGRLAG